MDNDLNRIINQTNDEWVEEYDSAPFAIGISAHQESLLVIDKPQERQRFALHPDVSAVLSAPNKLIIQADGRVTPEVDQWIKEKLDVLSDLADPADERGLYQYSGYRTFFSCSHRRPMVAIEFVDIFSGAQAERYYNCELRDTAEKGFKTGRNGRFRVVGSVDRPRKGSLLHFWLKAAKECPNNRPSHIYRYMNSWLRDLVVKCDNPVPHHDITKLKDIDPVGWAYSPA